MWTSKNLNVGLPSRGSIFSSTPGRLEKKIFYHFEMENIALILIYNIFVTKKIFFMNEHQKKILTRTFLVLDGTQ